MLECDFNDTHNIVFQSRFILSFRCFEALCKRESKLEYILETIADYLKEQGV